MADVELLMQGAYSV